VHVCRLSTSITAILSPLKEQKSLSPETFLGLKISPESVCGRSSVPDPNGVAHSAPRHISWIRGIGEGMGKGKEGKGGEGKLKVMLRLMTLNALSEKDAT